MTIWRLLQFIGAGGLVVVVLTHVAETLELFPEMGWGLPTSPGHYLDLVSAILGCTLLLLGFLGNAIVRRKNSRRGATSLIEDGKCPRR
jgi:hypothetical protein